MEARNRRRGARKRGGGYGLADLDVLDITRPRVIEQEALDLVDRPTTRGSLTPNQPRR